jgi:outer membrane lipoprotein LolB
MVVYLFAICSCSTPMFHSRLMPENANNLSKDHAEAIAGFNNWSFASRFFLRSDEDSFSGDLKWKQQGDVFTLEFSGPFGVGNVVVKGNAKIVKLVTSDGQSVLAKTPESLMEFQFGWIVPISHFRYWVLGIPDPRLSEAVTNMAFDATGRWIRFSQAECNVDILGYYENRTPALPRKIFVVCGERESRIAFRDWEVSS